MWAFMSGDIKNFATSNKAGKDRVHKDDGKYAFLMESTSVEYIVERECELTQIGGLLDSKGYGIALPPSENKLINFNKYQAIPANTYFVNMFFKDDPNFLAKLKTTSIFCKWKTTIIVR